MSEQQRRRNTSSQRSQSSQRRQSSQEIQSSQRNSSTQRRTSSSKRRMSKKQLRRRRQRNRRIAMAVMCLIIAVLLFLCIKLFFDNGKEESNYKQGNNVEESVEVTPTDTPIPTPTPEPLPMVDFSVLDSKSGILVRLEDGAVAVEKDADAVIYPASMTKIMTALIGIENISDVNQTITIDQATYDRLYLEGASLAGFPAGTPVPVLDMLYGVMLPSGAECCVGIAEHIYGSENAFVDAMNAKAQELGMTNTHFVTTTGLHDEQHYTTVRDLTLLLKYALQNETFKTIYCTKEYTSQTTGLHFTSTMFKKMSSSSVTGGEILGGKTG